MRTNNMSDMGAVTLIAGTFLESFAPVLSVTIGCRMREVTVFSFFMTA